MKLTSSLEDYLEAIYNEVKDKGEAKVTDIARILDVKKASVTGALVNLAKRNLINYQPYLSITLTKEGEKAAIEIIKKHTIISDFLVNILNLSVEEAAENACRMEHIMSENMFERFMKFSLFMQDLCANNTAIKSEIEKLFFDNNKDI